MHEIIDGLREGRLVQLLVTNWPKPELNHTVVAYESRPVAGGIEFLVWDPNNPDGPGIMTWDSSAQHLLGDEHVRHRARADPGVPDVLFAATMSPPMCRDAWSDAPAR